MATRRRASQSSLTGSISDLQRRVKYLQNRQNPTRLGNQSVLRTAIQYRAVGTDQIAPNSIVNDQIQADAIKQAQIDTDAVTRDAIKDGEVIESKLGLDAVTRDKIKAGEVVDGKLGDASVNLVNMKPNSVANTQLTTDSVNFRTVDTNAIGNENMLDNSVGNGEMQNDSIGNAEMRNDSVGFAELQSSSVGTSTLQSGSVTSSRIASGAVGNAQLADGAVSGGKIANGTISGNKIADGAISGAKIAQNTINSGNLTSAARVVIVRGGINSGAGISVTSASNGVNILAAFGGGSANVARGNHRHTYTGPITGGRSLTTSAPVDSSQNYKKDISSYTIDNPKRLLDLDLKKYKYKNDRRAAHQEVNREWLHGYIVEELAAAGLEEALGYDNDGKPVSIMYNSLIMYIIEVLKEQEKEIAKLKEELTK